MSVRKKTEHSNHTAFRPMREPSQPPSTALLEDLPPSTSPERACIPRASSSRWEERSQGRRHLRLRAHWGCRARRSLALPCPPPPFCPQTKDGTDAAACAPPEVSVRLNSGRKEGSSGALTTCHHRCLTLSLSAPQNRLQHHCGPPDTTESSPHTAEQETPWRSQTLAPFPNSR